MIIPVNLELNLSPTATYAIHLTINILSTVISILNSLFWIIKRHPNKQFKWIEICVWFLTTLIAVMFTIRPIIFQCSYPKTLDSSISEQFKSNICDYRALFQLIVTAGTNIVIWLFGVASTTSATIVSSQRHYDSIRLLPENANIIQGILLFILASITGTQIYLLSRIPTTATNVQDLPGIYFNLFFYGSTTILTLLSVIMWIKYVRQTKSIVKFVGEPSAKFVTSWSLTVRITVVCLLNYFIGLSLFCFSFLINFSYPLDSLQNFGLVYGFAFMSGFYHYVLTSVQAISVNMNGSQFISTHSLARNAMGRLRDKRVNSLENRSTLRRQHSRSRPQSIREELRLEVSAKPTTPSKLYLTSTSDVELTHPQEGSAVSSENEANDKNLPAKRDLHALSQAVISQAGQLEARPNKQKALLRLSFENRQRVKVNAAQQGPNNGISDTI
ncbi:hypothetical protein BKA69DRAFT_1122614 [Paraphysoderma sedebokerense]|nr:hypothetical protein BKA69DRAFT_1122614 [Paraphysoderma sedebokerense]